MSVDKRYSELGSGLDVSSLSVYLREINKISLLTRQEEVDLARGARDGVQDSKDRLIKANLRFVVNVAKITELVSLTLLVVNCLENCHSLFIVIDGRFCLPKSL